MQNTEQGIDSARERQEEGDRGNAEVQDRNSRFRYFRNETQIYRTRTPQPEHVSKMDDGNQKAGKLGKSAIFFHANNSVTINVYEPPGPRSINDVSQYNTEFPATHTTISQSNFLAPPGNMTASEFGKNLRPVKKKSLPPEVTYKYSKSLQKYKGDVQRFEGILDEVNPPEFQRQKKELSEEEKRVEEAHQMQQSEQHRWMNYLNDDDPPHIMCGKLILMLVLCPFLVFLMIFLAFINHVLVPLLLFIKSHCPNFWAKVQSKFETSYPKWDQTRVSCFTCPQRMWTEVKGGCPTCLSKLKSCCKKDKEKSKDLENGGKALEKRAPSITPSQYLDGPSVFNITDSIKSSSSSNPDVKAYFVDEKLAQQTSDSLPPSSPRGMTTREGRTK